MADKPISELIAATQVTPSDLFVLEQSGTAKKLTGQVLENWLLSFADGHGGIQKLEKVGTDGLVDTYRITFADTTVFDYVVTNGRSVDSIRKTSTSGLVDTYSISYNDGTANQFTVTNGAKGDKGDNTYLWIKYASQQPTASSHSFGDVPDAWMGIYYGSLDSAPASWDMYRWYKIKGDTGDTGAAATLLSSSVTYQVSTSGTTIPSGAWLDSVPSVAQGSYLWTRVINTFNSGSPIISYSVSRMGIDGTGTVISVNTVSPDINGNVTLSADRIAVSSIDSTPVSEALARRQAVVTSDVVDAAITRAKLAQDALFSPFISSNSRALVASDLGGTVQNPWNTSASYTLTQAFSSTLPNGATIAVLRGGTAESTSVKIIGDGVRIGIPDENIQKNATVELKGFLCLVALRKVANDNINGDMWAVFGNVEVVE